MNTKIGELMVTPVLTAEPHQTVEHVRAMMSRNKVHLIPLVSTDGELRGVVSSSDFLGDLASGAPVSKLMTEKVYTVAKYDDVHIAARVMRNHKVHHVIVTHEKRVVGILSSFDLLKLVEDHRFVMKAAPTPSNSTKRKRR